MRTFREARSVLMVATTLGCGASQSQPTTPEPSGDQSSGAAAAKAAPALIFGAGVVTSDAGDIGPGGFDARIDGGTHLVNAIKDCSSKVLNEGRQWATEHQLAVLKDRPTALLLGSRDLNGMFELLYSVKPNVSASVSLLFYDEANKPSAPELGDFTSYEITPFTSRLKKALECP